MLVSIVVVALMQGSPVSPHEAMPVSVQQATIVL